MNVRLQESLASELAARMNAMNSASDNAADLKKKLSLKYNRIRQAKVRSSSYRHTPANAGNIVQL